MRGHHSLLACLFLAATSACAQDELGKEVPILETYQATVGKELKAELSADYIVTAAKWKETWTKIHPKEKLPEIDFTKHILLSSTQDKADPNRQTPMVQRDKNGTITVTILSTLIGYESSDQTIYRFHQVSRAGVTGVNRFDEAQKKWVVDPLPK